MSGTDQPSGVPWSLPDGLGAALADTVRGIGASAGGLYLVEETEPALRLVALCGLPVHLSVPWRRLPLAASGPVADAVREDRLVWVGSRADMARRYPRASAAVPYRFVLGAVPLRGVRRLWGGIVLLWPADHPREAAPRERSHLTSSARRLARLLDDAPRPPVLPDQPCVVPVATSRHPVQTELAAADYAERLPEGGLALDLEGRTTFVTATAARLLGLDADRLLGTRPWQALHWLDEPACEQRYRTAVVSRTPQSFTALRPPDHWLLFELYPGSCGISVRIISEARHTPRGVRLAVPRRTAAKPAGPLYPLVHLAATLSETGSVRDLVDVIADEILPAFRAQGLVLSVADAGRLRITGCHGYASAVIERVDGLSLDTDLTPVGQVLASGAPAFFASAAELARTYPRAPQISDKQAWAFLPLIVTGRPVGCCVLSYDHPHTFTPDERAVLTPLAGLIAQTLDRVRLYDAKHQLVRGLQQTLLPRALPAVTGLDVAARYLPASHALEVGGDFYDLLRLDDTTAAAVIGDVEGHSIAAAALMGQVRTAIHAHATAGASPDQVLACTNRLLADLESELLVSCLYAQLDLARHTITLASAGHVPPLLRLARHQAWVLGVDPGPLLGVEPQVRYPLTAASLPLDAILALYTDGLVEVPGRDVARTIDGLVRQLADADDQDLEHLIDGLVHRTRPTGWHTDDIAVLLLRATGPRP
ncbi:SpoIIE family protein phosphatase [Streptomyces caeni]|uniref:SpoIIE family protein phosphatase n=1 Tax=Streptomyces caeni TaxID=2307231 RepID=A0ABW4J057_9ACTN